MSSQSIRKRYHKTLGTSVINSLLSPPSLSFTCLIFMNFTWLKCQTNLSVCSKIDILEFIFFIARLLFILSSAYYILKTHLGTHCAFTSKKWVLGISEITKLCSGLHSTKQILGLPSSYCSFYKLQTIPPVINFRVGRETNA